MSGKNWVMPSEEYGIFIVNNYLACREPLNGRGILQSETQTRLFAFVLPLLRLESVPQSTT